MPTGPKGMLHPCGAPVFQEADANQPAAGKKRNRQKERLARRAGRVSLHLRGVRQSGPQTLDDAFDHPAWHLSPPAESVDVSALDTEAGGFCAQIHPARPLVSAPCSGNGTPRRPVPVRPCHGRDMELFGPARLFLTNQPLCREKVPQTPDSGRIAERETFG